MIIKKSKTGEDREPILKAFARFCLVMFIVAAVAIVTLTWQRTLTLQEQSLQHTSRLMAQGVRSHFATFDVVLRGLADELTYRDVFNNPQAGDRYLERVQTAEIGVVGYGLVGLDGEFIAASTRDLRAPLPNVAHDLESSASFQQVIDDERFNVGRPYYFDAIGDWIIPLRVPVYNQSGELSGVLTAGNRLDGGDAMWARLPVPQEVTLALVRDDGYLNYMHPLPEGDNRLSKLFGSQVSDEMKVLMEEESGFYFHKRESGIDGYREDYLWLEPVPDFELNVVAIIPRSEVLQAWAFSLLLPMGLWLLSAILTAWVYLRAKRLLQRADEEVRQKQSDLELSVDQYHELTRLIPIGVYQFRFTREGSHEMTYTSARFRDILQIPEKSLDWSLADHVYRQLHPEDALSFYKHQEFATKNTREFYWEGRLVQRGAERWLSVHSVPSQEVDTRGRLWNGVVVDITERKEAEQKINLLAYYDALTQLPNRRLLRERLQESVQLAAKGTEFAALLFIDVDKFKQLNDSFGHAEGDRMLRQIGSRLQKLVREYDTVARLGGDEFVVLLTRLVNDADKAASQVEVVLQKIERLLNEPFDAGQQSVRVTLSTGITLIDGSEKNLDNVMQQADQAMYRAKDAGRNTQCFYDAHIQHLITEQLELQNDLRQAIGGDQLELYYQVQVKDDQSVAGVEALIRWHHPQRGMVMPGSFIHIAEQSDDIVRLGDWILRQACEQLVAWRDEPARRDWTIAVNVSVRQLRADDFAEKVLVTLAETGARPQQLLIEITESMLLIDTEMVIEKMARLKRAGVKFSLDDFGTGYSSLGYLNRLPIDELKIDQSFVRDMDQEAHHKVLIRTILSLGQTLSLTTIAEGVETEAQFRTLRELGCQHFQGYYFGRPVAVQDLPD
ncbi:bifunctional diguanylate cyclase/phosphodiesterase [Aliidiomarina sp. Khilg15.8]